MKFLVTGVAGSGFVGGSARAGRGRGACFDDCCFFFSAARFVPTFFVMARVC